MTAAEDLLRSTTRAIAETVRDVPALRLHPITQENPVTTYDPPALNHTFPPRAGRPRRHWPAWLAPASAAAAVAIVAAGLVVFKTAARDAAATNHGQHAAAPVPAGTGVPSVRAGVPEYYAAVDTPGKKGAAQGLMVADTVTGKTVATVAPPAGRTFTGVSAAADDRTFIGYALPAAGSGARPGTWYEVRFRPGGGATLTRLKVPALASVLSMAVSPSGGKLAVVLADSAGAARTLLVYSVTTGRLLHAWPHGLSGFFNSETWQEGTLTPELSWFDGDSELAFPAVSAYPGGKAGAGTWMAQIWHLNLSRGGSNVTASSGLVWSMNVPLNSTSPRRCLPFSTPLLSADGKTVVCVAASVPRAQTGALTYRQTASQGARWTVAWLSFAISAPGTARTLYATTVPAGKGIALQPVWTNASGTAALAEWGPLTSPTTVSALHFGVVGHGALTRYAPPRVSGTDVGFFLPSVAW